MKILFNEYSDFEWSINKDHISISLRKELQT